MRRALLGPLCVAALLWGCPPPDHLQPDPSAPPVDEPTDASAVPDTSVVDATAEDAAVDVCATGTRSFELKPTQEALTVCSPTEIDEMVNCLVRADREDRPLSVCGATLDEASAECQACLLSPTSAARWGALVSYADGWWVPNWGGCLASYYPEAEACAEQMHDVAECRHIGDLCPAVSVQQCSDSAREMTECLGPFLPGIGQHKINACFALDGRPRDYSAWSFFLRWFCPTLVP